MPWSIGSLATAERDLINAISFLLPGSAVNHFTMKTKLRDLLNQNYVAHERDTDPLTVLYNGAAGRRAIENYFVNDPAPF